MEQAIIEETIMAVADLGIGRNAEFGEMLGDLQWATPVPLETVFAVEGLNLGDPAQQGDRYRRNRC